MTSFVAKKEHVFYEARPVLARKRSEGRIKTYGSATDTRAWSVADEQRRQYILDLMGQGKKSKLGKFIPVEVLMDILLSQKNADIAKLKKKVDLLQKLLMIYEKLDLTECQQAQFDQMRRDMQISNCELLNLTESINSEVGSTYRSDTEITIEDESLDEDVCDDETCVGLNSERADFSKDFMGDDGRCTCGEDGPLTGRSDKSTKISVCSAFGNEYKDMDVNTLAKLLQERDEEIEMKKNLAKKAIEQLESLKGVMGERDDLKRQLQLSKVRICTMECEKRYMAKAIISCLKPPDLTKLEEDIARLREQECVTPEQETEIIKMELEVLKCYCDKLSNIQEENDQLKREVDALKCKIYSSTPKASELDDLEKELQKSVARINDLEKRVSEAQHEIYQSCDYQTMKRKADMLGNVEKEKHDLEKQLEKMCELEGKVKVLKKRASEADELERDVRRLQCQCEGLQNVQEENYQLKAEKEQINKCLGEIRAERDQFQKKLNELSKYIEDCQKICCERNCLQIEVDHLREKAQQLEVMRIERDRLLLRIDELESLENELLQLVEINQVTNREKDALRRQVCDYECIIADQEDELKTLITQVDNMSAADENQQEQLRQTLECMRSELEKKEELINATTEGKQTQIDCLQDELNDMEEQLRNTMDKLTNELSEKDSCIECLKCKLTSVDGEAHSLTKDLSEKSRLIKEMKEEVCKCKNAAQRSEEAVCAMRAELKKMQAENMQLQDLIGQLKKVCQGNHAGVLLSETRKTIGVLIKDIECFCGDIGANFETCNGDVVSAVVKSSDEVDCNQLSQALDIAQAEINRLKADIETIKSRKTGVSKECSCDITTDDVNYLQSQLVCACEAAAKLQKENQSLLDCSGKDGKLLVENKALRRHSMDIEQAAKQRISELSKRLEEALQELAELKCQSGEYDPRQKSKPQSRKMRGGDDTCACPKPPEQPPDDEELIKLKEKIKKYCEQTSLLTAENDTLRTTIQRLECQCETLKVATLHNNQQIVQLKGQLQEILAERLKLEEENDFLKCQLKKLEEQVKELNSNVDNSQVALLSSISAQFQDDMTLLKEENEKLKEAILELENNVKDLERISKEEAESNCTRNTSLQKFVDRLQDSLASKRDEVDELTKENDELKRKITGLLEQSECMKKAFEKQTASASCQTAIKEQPTSTEEACSCSANVPKPCQGSVSRENDLKRQLNEMQELIEELQAENECLKNCFCDHIEGKTKGSFTERVVRSPDGQKRSHSDDQIEGRTIVSISGTIRRSPSDVSRDENPDEKASAAETDTSSYKTAREGDNKSKQIDYEKVTRELEDENESYKKQLEELTAKMEDCVGKDDIMVKLNSQMEQFKMKLEECLEKDEIILKLNNELEMLRAKLDESSKDEIICMLKAEIEQLKKMLAECADKDETIYKLKYNLEQSQEKLNQEKGKDNEISKLCIKNDQLLKELEGCRKRIEELENKLELQKQEPGPDRPCAANEALEEQICAANKRAAELEAFLDGMKQLSEGGVTGALSPPDNRCKDLEDLIKQLQREKAQCESMLKAYEEKVRICEGKIKGYEAKIRSYEDKLKASEAKIKACEDKIMAGKGQESRIKDLEDLIKKLQQEKKDCEENLKGALSKERRASKDKVQELEDLINKLKKELKDCEEQMSAALERERRKSKELRDINEAMKRGMSGDNAMLKDENDDLRKQLEALKKQLTVAEGAKGDATKACEDQLQSQLDANKKLQDMLKELEAKLAAMQNQSPPVISEDKANPQALNDCLEELKKLKAENAKLQGDVNKCKEDNKRLEADLLKTVEDSRKLQDQLKELQDRARKLEDEKASLQAAVNAKPPAVVAPAPPPPPPPPAEDLEAKLKDLLAQLEACKDNLEAEKNKTRGLQDQLNAEREKIKKMTEEHENALKLLKDQYDRDVGYLKARASDGMANLQNLHEEELDTVNKEFEKEVDHLTKQSQETLKTLKDVEDKLKKASDDLEEERRLSSSLKQKVEDQFECETGDKEVQVEECVDGKQKGTAVITELTYTCPCKSRDPRKKNALSRRTLILANVVPENLENFTIPDFPPPESVPVCGTPEREVPECLTETQKLFQKATHVGLECLTFEELSKLHELTCHTTAKLYGKTNVRQKKPDSRGETDTSDKVSLLRRIAFLENSLATKHQITQGKILELESSLRTDKEHLENLKKSLQAEKLKNNDLMGHLGRKMKESSCVEVERDLLRKQIQFHEGRVERLVAGMEYEKRKLKLLEEQLHIEKNNNRHLQTMLEGEKEKQNCWKKKTKDTFQTMKSRMEEALDNEYQLKLQLAKPKNDDKCSCISEQKKLVSSSFTTDLTLKSENKKKNVVHQVKILAPKR